jgi:hypothetical protein
VKYMILNVWVRDGYQLEHEYIGPFDESDQAAAFAEKYIDQRHLEMYGRLWEAFIIADDGENTGQSSEEYVEENDLNYTDGDDAPTGLTGVPGHRALTGLQGARDE